MNNSHLNVLLKVIEDSSKYLKHRVPSRIYSISSTDQRSTIPGYSNSNILDIGFCNWKDS